MKNHNIPEPPKLSEWAFVDEAKQYSKSMFGTKRKETCPDGMVDLKNGINLIPFKSNENTLKSLVIIFFYKFLGLKD